MARRTVLDHILSTTSLQLQGFEAQEQRLLHQLSSSAQLTVPQGPALQSVLSWAAGIPLPDDAGDLGRLGAWGLACAWTPSTVTAPPGRVFGAVELGEAHGLLLCSDTYLAPATRRRGRSRTQKAAQSTSVRRALSPGCLQTSWRRWRLRQCSSLLQGLQ